MAISARFEADFSSFSSAVKNAEVSLKSFESGAGRVETALNRMTDSFSGRKVIQDAQLMVEAVERIGGTSKLTEAELNKLGSKAQETVAKMKAMGVDVPPALQQIADHTTKATKTQDAMIASAKNLAATLGLTFSVGAVIQFGRELLALADDLVKTSDRTGLTIEQVQRLSFVAGQSGNTIDQLTGAIGKMQVNLTNPKAQAALRDMNVNLTELRSADTYGALQLIARGFGNITDPAEQARAAVTIFGRSGLEILPTLKSEFDKLANGVAVASDRQVRALEEAGDALERMQTRMKNWAVGAAGNVVLVAEQFGVLQTALALVAPGMASLAGIDFNEMVDSAQRAAKSVEDVNLAVQKNPLVEYRKHLAELRKESIDLTDTQKWLIEQGHALGESNAEIAAGLVTVGETAVAAYLKMVDGAKKAAEEVAKLAEVEKKLFFDMRIWGTHQLEEMTRAVNAELRKQMDAMGAAAAQMVTMQNEGKARLEALFDPAPVTGMEAEITKLDKRFKDYEATLTRLSTTAGPAWQKTAEQIRQQLAVEYDRTFTDIITRTGTFNTDVAATVAGNAPMLGGAAQTATQPIVNNFIGSFNQIESGARQMVSSIQGTLNALRDSELNRLATQFFGNVFGDVGEINRRRAPGVPRPFADGGLVTGPTLGLLGEAGPELVIPLNKGGAGLSIHVSVAPGYEGPGAAARVGREVGEAIATRLRSQGRRM